MTQGGIPKSCFDIQVKNKYIWSSWFRKTQTIIAVRKPWTNLTWTKCRIAFISNELLIFIFFSFLFASQNKISKSCWNGTFLKHFWKSHYPVWIKQTFICTSHSSFTIDVKWKGLISTNKITQLPNSNSKVKTLFTHFHIMKLLKRNEDKHDKMIWKWVNTQHSRHNYIIQHSGQLQ